MKYFEKYGEITDSVIMKDRHTGRPRGFGFITYADPSVVDQVIQENHVVNGKQVLFFFFLFDTLSLSSFFQNGRAILIRSCRLGRD